MITCLACVCNLVMDWAYILVEFSLDQVSMWETYLKTWMLK